MSNREIGSVVGYPDEMVATVVGALTFDAFGDAYTDTQRVLDALSAAGYLVPEGSEREWRCADLGGMGYPGRDAEAGLRRHAEVSGHALEWRAFGPWTPVDGGQG